MLKVRSLDHVALAVRDVPAAIRWYSEVLGLEQAGHWGAVSGDPAFMMAGETSLALFPVDGAAPKPPPGSDTIAMRHVAFRVDRATFDQAEEALRAHGLSPRFADHGNSHSYYVKDPDGHTLEVTTYELR